MQTLYAIQCLAFEDLGSFAPVLQRMGYQIQYLQLGVDDLAVALQSKQPVIVLGGPIGVYETNTYPYLKQLIADLAQRLQRNEPTLGICLGAQLIASALGAKVYAGHVKEIGWSRLTLTNQGLASPLKVLESVHVLHWHGDTFDLPDQAKRLASSIYYPNQAFAVGLNILALQFHAEADPQTFERWLIGHTVELNKAGIDIVTLREESARYGQQLKESAEQLLRDWLSNLIPV